MGVIEDHPTETLAHVPVSNVLSKIGHTFVVSDPTLPDCPVVFASDSFLRLTGYSREEVLGHNCRFMQGDETDRAAVRQLRKAVTRAEPITVRLVNYKKSGEPWWNLLTLSPVKNAAGKVIKIVGVQIDVTSQPPPESPSTQPNTKAQAVTTEVANGVLRVEDAVPALNQMPKAQMAKINKAFVVSDPTLPDCPIVFVSDQFLQLTEYSRNEILGRNCRFLQGKGTDPSAVADLRSAIERGNSASVRLLNYKKSGEPFWNLLNVTPVKNAAGNVVKLIGTQMDVTAIIEAEGTDSTFVSRNSRAIEESQMAMREIAASMRVSARVTRGSEDDHGPPRVSLLQRLSQQFNPPKVQHAQTPIGKRAHYLGTRVPRVAMDLATTVERMDHGFVVCDPNMEEFPIVFASDTFMRQLGLPRELVLGKNPCLLMGPEFESAKAKELKEKLTSLTETSMEFEAFHSSGQMFNAVLNFFPMKDVNGECRFMVAVLLTPDPQDGGLTSLVDTEGVNTAIQDLMREGNPFDELDRVSGRVRQRIHTQNDKGYQLLMAATENGPLELSQFTLVKPLGVGASGQVMLMELGETGHCFAIKSVCKSDMVKRNKVGRVIAEDRILSEIDHPFLALCYGTICSPTHIHYVLKHCEGGDLYSVLNANGEMKEAHLRFYAAEVLVALKYLHMLGYIYRDLKPENLLLSDGHIVLTDFDLAYTKGNTTPSIYEKEADVNDAEPVAQGTCGCGNNVNGPSCVPRQKPEPQILGKYMRLVAEPQARANSFVGTQEYLAPEIIAGKGHSAPVDWWSFGILCYELAFGTTPFRSLTQALTFDSITYQPVTFPEDKSISPDLKSLLLGLLEKDPEKRLGSRDGAEEIQAHPFFSSINWALLQHYRAPFSPDNPDTQHLKKPSGIELGQVSFHF